MRWCAGPASRSALGQPGPVLTRCGLQMADGALLRLVMIGLAPLTGEAERPGRLQGRNSCGGVAFVAGPMRIHRRGVGLDDAFGAMARRAVDARRVVVVV